MDISDIFELRAFWVIAWGAKAFPLAYDISCYLLVWCLFGIFLTMQSDNDQVVTTRLFVVESLKAQKTLRASASQAHYLRHVLRAQEGSPIALFNGRDGEWLA